MVCKGFADRTKYDVYVAFPYVGQDGRDRENDRTPCKPGIDEYDSADALDVAALDKIERDIAMYG